MGIKIGDKVKGFNDTNRPNEACNKEYRCTFGKIGTVIEVENYYRRISVEFKINDKFYTWRYDMDNPEIKRYIPFKNKLK